MIGAFYQPKSVIIDTATLATLPDRELSAGLAEVIKYGLITDVDFFCWLEQNIDAILLRQSDALVHIIEQSCVNKARIVASDERESGRRALLNLGHTFGHAIEAHQGYGKWLHGEAVATGIMVAAHLSHLLGWLNDNQRQRIQNLLIKAHLPVQIPADMSAMDFYEKMQVDKKVVGGKIRYILLKDIGEATIESNVSKDDVITAINRCR